MSRSHGSNFHNLKYLKILNHKLFYTLTQFHSFEELLTFIKVKTETGW